MNSPPEFHSEANRASICRNARDEKTQNHVFDGWVACRPQNRRTPGGALCWADENKVRTCPERRGNAAPGPGCKNNVKIIGRLETFDHGWQQLRLGHRQMG